MKKKIRYAVVGLGHIAQTAVLPAFEHAKNSELAALITGHPEKERKLSDRYEVKAYTYDDLENAFDEQDVDAVYIATPNMHHREHTERAACAGVHVLCEKPMATTQEDCEAMMQGTDENMAR
jgi:predicted dehydrogenase